MKSGCVMLLTILLGLGLGGCSKEDLQGFSKVDYNKDGKIIFEELIVVFPDLTVEEFLAADADQNGALDEKEYERFRQARLSGKKLDASSAPPAAAKPAAAPAPKPEEAKPKAEAAPAAPAAKPEPTTPAAPAAPATKPEPTTPAAPAAPGKPAEPATSEASVPAATEVVETVVAETIPTEPAKTYTVARGDSLTRIAKRFGVSPKALMAANNMKNADHLEAGASITIPAPGGDEGAGPAAPPAVTDFVAAFFTKNAAGDLNGLIDCYGETVDYYKKGKSRTDIVRQDKADAFARWPERSYTPGTISAQTLPGGDVRVTAPAAFVFKKGDKSIRGQITFTFLLRPVGGAFRIIGEQSVIAEKK
jgi:LysM repeat protein